MDSVLESSVLIAPMTVLYYGLRETNILRPSPRR